MTKVTCDVCGDTFQRADDIRFRRFEACSDTCRRKGWTQLTKKRKAERRANTTCSECGEAFTPERSDALYCGAACKQRAYRKRKM